MRGSAILICEVRRGPCLTRLLSGCQFRNGPPETARRPEWCIEQGETELAMRLPAPLWWEKVTERTGRAVGSWAERVIEMDGAEDDPGSSWSARPR